MAFLHSLPALHSLEINDSNVTEKWSEWKEMWEHYSVASKVNKEEGDVQVAALLTAIGPEARKVFKTWNLSATERKDIKGVIERFDNYCNPRKNIPFERYLFNSRQQEPGESFDRYVTATIQPSQFSTLPDKVKSLFAIKSKKPWRNYTVQRSFNQCQSQRPGSHLC